MQYCSILSNTQNIINLDVFHTTINSSSVSFGSLFDISYFIGSCMWFPTKLKNYIIESQRNSLLILSISKSGFLCVKYISLREDVSFKTKRK